MVNRNNNAVFVQPRGPSLSSARFRSAGSIRTTLRDARVAVVQPPDLRNGDYPTPLRRLHDARARGVIAQGAVGPCVVVVIEVAGQDALEVGLVDHDHVIQTLPPD